jgi:hypothetical protein
MSSDYRYIYGVIPTIIKIKDKQDNSKKLKNIIPIR